MKKFLYVLYVMSFALMLSCAKTDQPVQKQESNYLARVNNTTISVEDVKKEFSMLPAEIQQLYITEDGMESLLDEIIKKELLYQEAAKRGYNKTPKFTQQMEEFNKRLLIEYLLRDEIEKKITISDNAVKDFYDANKDNFVQDVPGEDKQQAIEFERVKDLIKDRLVAEQQRTAFDTYVQELKDKANIEIDEASIREALGNSTTPSE